MDVFNFHLNESLYFEKGQEVLQMVGISLDPDISIQPYDDYVSIRGVMELKGEYEKDPFIKQMETEPLDLSDHARRYVEQIESTADNFAAFSHRFPVEISVPSYRIESIDDITVDVASFDYELPDANHLKLMSTISIYGIQNQDPEPIRDEMWDEEENADEVGDISELQVPDQFEFALTADELNEQSESQDLPDRNASNAEPEVTVQHEHQDQTDKPVESETFEKSDRPSEPETSESLDVPESETERENPEKQEAAKESEEKERWHFKKTQSFESFFKKDGKNDQVETEEEPSSKETENVEELAEEEAFVGDTESADHGETTDIEATNMEINEGDVEETEEEDGENDKINFLSSFFRDEDDLEENQSTQLRICIVQDQDTLESISERYDISKLQILKQNRLQDDQIQTGQLLSIPEGKQK